MDTCKQIISRGKVFLQSLRTNVSLPTSRHRLMRKVCVLGRRKVRHLTCEARDVVTLTFSLSLQMLTLLLSAGVLLVWSLLSLNAYTHRTRAGAHLVKNPKLEAVLDEKGYNTDSVWKTVVASQGSVQHLEWLSDDEKAVFKTAYEIDQGWVVEHAGDRQQYICQAQSVNLFFPANSPASYVNSVHLRAWKEKLKSLYYLRTDAGIEADKVGLAVERVALQDAEECVSCHG